MNVIHGKGWFVHHISALACGEEGLVKNHKGYYTLDSLLRDLKRIAEAGFAKVSNKGRYVLDHPNCGQIAWKCGINFRTTKPYFFIWLNGKLIYKETGV